MAPALMALVVLLKTSMCLQMTVKVSKYFCYKLLGGRGGKAEIKHESNL